MTRIRSLTSMLLVVGAVVGLTGCDGDNGTAPSSMPQIVEGTVAIEAFGGTVVAFQVNREGTLSSRVDWNNANNDIDSGLVRGTCTEAQILTDAEGCREEDALVIDESLDKPSVFTAPVTPGPYTLEPGPGFVGHFGNIGETGDTGVTRTSTLAAYDPATGERVWYAESPGITNGGNLVTAGNVVFQGVGTGDFYAFDAESGERLFSYTAERPISASPLTYQVNGTQYVAIAATNAILVFGLP